jgi:outer membrane protein TolC
MNLPGSARLTALWLAALAAAGALAGCVHYQPAPIHPDETASALEARSLDAPGLKTFLEANHHADSTAWDFETLTLAALYWHPSLDIARTEWASTHAGETTAAARPNPTVSAGPDYNFNAASGLTPWIGNLNLDWPVETAGKRGKRIARAQSLSTAARLRLGIVAWQVRSQLRAALLEHAAAASREQLLVAQLAVQEKIVERLESKIRAGAATRLEASPARIALAKARIEAGAARSAAAEARARVAEAIGIPASALAGVRWSFPLEVPASAELTSAEARRAALLGRADVLAALADYAAAEATLRLEIAKQYPDLHLGTGYQYDQGENKWGLSVGAELPLLNRNQGPIAEAMSKRAEFAARFTAVQAKAIAEIDRALAAWQAAQEQLADLAPLDAALRQQAETVTAQAKAGAAEPLDVLAAEAELATSAVAQFDARRRAVQALGQLEDALQRPFDALKTIEQSREQQANLKGKQP